MLVAVCGLCGCGCLQACTTTLNQFSVMRAGGEGGRRAVDNGWEGVLTKLHLSMHSTISGFRKLVTSTSLCAKDKCVKHTHTHIHTHIHTHTYTHTHTCPHLLKVTSALPYLVARDWSRGIHN